MCLLSRRELYRPLFKIRGGGYLTLHFTMNKIEQQLKRFQKIDIWKIVGEILIELSPVIIEMNQRQLLEGKMDDGSPTLEHTLSPRSEVYVQGKIEDGTYNTSIFPHYNYFNEGDFFRGFVTKLEANGLMIESTDEKGGELITALGESNVYGLTDENLGFLIEMMIPTVQKRIRNELGY